jgi:hypothetical protein
MSLFCPCDDVNYKIFISQIYLNKYKNSMLYNLNEWKKMGNTVDIYDGALIVDVQKDILLIIIEFIIYDFDMNKIPLFNDIILGVQKASPKYLRNKREAYLEQDGNEFKLNKIYYTMIYLGLPTDSFKLSDKDQIYYIDLEKIVDRKKINNSEESILQQCKDFNTLLCISSDSDPCVFIKEIAISSVEQKRTISDILKL